MVTREERKRKLRQQIIRDQVAERNRVLAEKIVTEIVANNGLEYGTKRSIIAVIESVLNE